MSVITSLTDKDRIFTNLYGFQDWSLKAAQARGIARHLTDEAVQRMREDLVFDPAPAQRDFGYAPRGFAPTAAMLGQ